MFQTVDAIPEHCGKWFTKCLSFKDRPHEYFTVRHRNPIEAIRGLWGDPSFTNHLIYKPAKMFRGKKKTEDERMYSEMWTGGSWNTVQVCSLYIFVLHYKLKFEGYQVGDS